MPELPEVETTRRGIEPFLTTRRVADIIVRQPQLRWPVPVDIQQMRGQRISAVKRRGKYILLYTEPGTAILHLGMSGTLRILSKDTAPQKHDHVDLVLDNHLCLRFHDPRRFGACLWTTADPLQHALLAQIGPEPLEEGFNTDYLYTSSRKSGRPIKLFIMDGRIVAGVGNIYANEALFIAKIDPRKAAGRLTRVQCAKLTAAIKEVLRNALAAGGTTLRDFQNSDGKPGYFQQALNVYGREGQNCIQCGKTVEMIRMGQRSTFYCPGCQR